MAALNNDQTQQKFPDPPNFAVRVSIALLFLYAGVLKMMCRFSPISQGIKLKDLPVTWALKILSHYATISLCYILGYSGKPHVCQ